LPAGALERLGAERASAIAAALKEGGVDAGRVATANPQPAEAAGKQVPLKLGLDAR
jgi:hypothetical protein